MVACYHTVMEAGVSHRALAPSSRSFQSRPSLQSQAGYGSLCFKPARFLSLSATSAAVTSTRKKQQQRPSPKGPSSQDPAPKPSRLLRTWTEGRKVPSTSTGSKLQVKPAPSLRERTADVLTDEGMPLDTFYLEEQDSQDEEEEEDEEDYEYAEHHSSSEDAEHRKMQSLPDSESMDLNCQHFKGCSGCVIETALDQPPIFKDAQRFFRCHGIQDLKLTTGSVWEWRCKAKLAVRGTSKNPVVGLYVEGTHDIVDIPNCRTHHPRINEAVKLLKTGIRELGIQPYDEDTGNGELRYVQMSITTYNTSIPAGERYANGRVQVALVWNARSEQSTSGALLSSLAQFFWQKGGSRSANPLIHSVWANFQTSRTNIIFGGRWRHLLGEQQCWERIGGVDVSLTPASFSQANLQAFESLLRKLQKFVKPGKAVVELYAGSGIIGLSLAVNCACRAVRCVEVNKEAKTPFELSLSRLSGSNNSRISWHCADVTVSPINWLKGSDVVVVDPPRKGLDASVIDALKTASSRGQGKGKPSSKEKSEKIEKRPWILRAQQAGVEAARELTDNESTWPDTLVYVSCGWEAFKRDCTDLVEDRAWHLFAGQAFNFFPGTDSIEVLAVFKRGKKSPKRSTNKKKVLKKKKSKLLGRNLTV